MRVDRRGLGQLVVQDDPDPVPHLGAQLRSRYHAVVGVCLLDFARLGLPLDHGCSELPLERPVFLNLGLDDLIALPFRLGREGGGDRRVDVAHLLRRPLACVR
jgi:hypothetical protein